MKNMAPTCGTLHENGSENANAFYGDAFKNLFTSFIAGTPIKRKAWDGYWKYRYGKIEMHCKDGSVVDFLETKDIIFTLSGILQYDWVVATPENCPLLTK